MSTVKLPRAVGQELPTSGVAPRFTLNHKLVLSQVVAALTEDGLLTRADGAPISGLPNLAGEPGMAYDDEKTVDLLGNPLELDPYGAHLEGPLSTRALARKLVGVVCRCGSPSSSRCPASPPRA